MCSGHSLEMHATVVIFWGFFWFFSLLWCRVFLDQQLLNGKLEGMDLVFKLTSFVSSHAGSDHGPGDTASTAQSCLGRDENVGDVLQRWRE